jgi:E3 ubiquitin-protein ligase RNF13
MSHLLLINLASGNVVLRTGDVAFADLPDLPAAFGPLVPPDGLTGLLVVAQPEDGCSRLERPDVEGPWVALLARSQGQQDCTFDVKVSRAEAAGAAAAIVWDDVIEGLVVMAKPPGNPDPGIPAVFVVRQNTATRASGAALHALNVPHPVASPARA